MKPRSNIHVWCVWLVYILAFLGSCAFACILSSSHPHNLIFACTFLCPRILTSWYCQVHVPLLGSLPPHILRLLVTLYPHMLLSLGSCTLCACWYPRILTSSYPYICSCILDVCWYPRILTSSYPCVHVVWALANILTSSHFHILRLQCLYLFGELESDKTTVLTKRKRPLGNK